MTRIGNPDPITPGIQGLTLANNATDALNDIDFAPGWATVEVDGVLRLARLASTMTKRLDATWAQGTNQGGLFSGTPQPLTTYHCFLLYKGGEVDCGFSTSLTASDRPAGWSARRIMSLRTESNGVTPWAGNIPAFTQWGDRIRLLTTTRMFSGTVSTSSGNNITAPIPAGIITNIFGYVQHNGSGGEFLSGGRSLIRNDSASILGCYYEATSNDNSTLNFYSNSASKVGAIDIHGYFYDRLNV